MNRAPKYKLIGLVVSLILTGCSGAPDMPTPEKIGEKERLRIISGEQAGQVVNKMHGQSVATDANLIAEYGQGEKKDVLYISRYADPAAAREAFVLMIEKMAVAKNSPFFHLMPIGK